MCKVLIDKVYTDGTQDVVPFEIDEERGTIIFDIIKGDKKGTSDICGISTFKKKYKEL